MLGRFSKLVIWLYGRGGPGRYVALKIINRLDGGEFYSPTLRQIFRRYYGVNIGSYTHGGCFTPHAFGPGTTIGRYTSIAAGAFAATDDHPMHYKGMHGFFFNPTLGYTHREWKFHPLDIGNDVWLGHNSIIQAGVNSIGDGAVVGAGAVVAKDVPPYAVVVGNPARVVRYRFPKHKIEELLAERWWDSDVAHLSERIEEFDRPYVGPDQQ